MIPYGDTFSTVTELATNLVPIVLEVKKNTNATPDEVILRLVKPGCSVFSPD